MPDPDDATEPDPVDDLGSSRADQRWTYVLLGGGGLLAFLVAPWVADWLRSLPFVPFQGVLQWLGDLTEPWQWVVRPLAGLVLGVVGAVLVLDDERRLEVGDDALVAVHGKDRRRLPRAEVVGVHRDGRRVVVDGRDGRTLFDHKLDAPRDAVRDAFVRRGYPWEND